MSDILERLRAKFDCNAAPIIQVPMTCKEFAELEVWVEKLREWERCVIEALVVNHTYSGTHDDNPQKALMDLITWEIKIALDPSVSTDAQALIDRGRQEALEEAAKVCDEMPKTIKRGRVIDSTSPKDCAKAIRALQHTGETKV